jgi:hypothetical protein
MRSTPFGGRRGGDSPFPAVIAAVPVRDSGVESARRIRFGPAVAATIGALPRVSASCPGFLQLPGFVNA